jgi:hypothetical protein
MVVAFLVGESLLLEPLFVLLVALSLRLARQGVRRRSIGGRAADGKQCRRGNDSKDGGVEQFTGHGNLRLKFNFDWPTVGQTASSQQTAGEYIRFNFVHGLTPKSVEWLRLNLSAPYPRLVQ